AARSSRPARHLHRTWRSGPHAGRVRTRRRRDRTRRPAADNPITRVVYSTIPAVYTQSKLHRLKEPAMNQICDTAVCMPDVQSSADTRQIAINKVGIKSIRHPVRVADKSGGVQHTIATFNMYVFL